MTVAVVISVKPKTAPTALLMATMFSGVGAVFFRLARCVTGLMLITVVGPVTTAKASRAALSWVV
jgi:hypothetical protein